MTTSRVRIVTYVDPELAAVIESTAKALNQTVSATAGEVLANAAPVLEVLRDMALDLQQAPDRHRAAMAKLAAFLRPLADEASEGVSGLETAYSDPPSTNRGVRT